MMPNNFKYIAFLITLLLCSCATLPKNEPLLKEEKVQRQIDLNFIETPQEYYSDEDDIEKFVTTIAAEPKREKKDISELIQQSQDTSTIEPKSRCDFQNSITKYTFEDGKLYSVIVGTNTLTDIRLEGGEIPSGDLILSDPGNYIIEHSISSEAGKDIYHIFIRCIEKAPWSTMIIPTNMRTYYLKLIPQADISMIGVKFIYKSNLPENRIKKHLSSLDNLNFNYLITGDNEVKPIAAFSDEKSTYIQFKASYGNTSTSPALYLEDKSGFSIINYSIKANMYITDFVLNTGEKFVLLQDSRRCEIKRGI